MHFCKRYRYRFGDIDDAGIAYYPSFFHYFHGCFEDWWSDALDKPYHELMHDDHLGLPAVRVECDFLRPVRYGDAPLIHLGVRRIGTASVAFGFWMTPQEVGADPLCRAAVSMAARNSALKRCMRVMMPSSLGMRALASSIV